MVNKTPVDLSGDITGTRFLPWIVRGKQGKAKFDKEQGNFLVVWMISLSLCCVNSRRCKKGVLEPVLCLHKLFATSLMLSAI